MEKRVLSFFKKVCMEEMYSKKQKTNSHAETSHTTSKFALTLNPKNSKASSPGATWSQYTV